MSRSALWRQEKNVTARAQDAENLWEQVVEEGRNNRAKGLVPLWGPDDSFHFNPMLLENIKKSSYFLKSCREISDWTRLVDEIYYKVDHVEPWAVDSPYIRAIGFLYLRYACDPVHIWGYIREFVYDEEPIQVRAKGSGGRNNSRDATIGGFVRSLFSSASTRDYYGTILPRLPIHLERELAVKLLQGEKVQSRAAIHFSNARTMEHFQRLGSKVMATYEDEENPLQWYDAVVDRIIHQDEDGTPFKHPRFVVTFTEYGNTETVTLGEMDLPDGKFYKEDSRADDGKRSYAGRDQGLYEEVRRRERDTVTATGRAQYCARPPTTKRSLAGSSSGAAPQDRRRRSPSPSRRSPPRYYDNGRALGRHPIRGNQPEEQQQPSQPPPRKRTKEELAAIEAKKRKLAARYG